MLICPVPTGSEETGLKTMCYLLERFSPEPLPLPPLPVIFQLLLECLSLNRQQSTLSLQDSLGQAVPTLLCSPNKAVSWELEPSCSHKEEMVPRNLGVFSHVTTTITS